MVSVDIRNYQILKFLTKGRPKLLRLAVAGKDGKPHVSSVWYLWKDDVFYITTSEDRLKVRAIRENPKVALVVDTDKMPYSGVIVEGRAKLTRKDVRKVTLAIVKKYVDSKSVMSQFKDLMRYPRILIKIEPTKSIDIMSYKVLG